MPYIIITDIVQNYDFRYVGFFFSSFGVCLSLENLYTPSTVNINAVIKYPCPY